MSEARQVGGDEGGGRQPFEHHAALSALIEDLGWTMKGVSLAKWGRFLEALNGALIEAREHGKQGEVERCAAWCELSEVPRAEQFAAHIRNLKECPTWSPPL